MIKTLHSNTISEIIAKLEVIGCFTKKYQMGQFLDWIYNKKIVSYNSITNLAKQQIDKISTEFPLISTEVVKVVESGTSPTKKLLIKTHDEQFIECVLLPDKNDKYTLCLSTQVGCTYRCQFCATGTMGFTRNLEKAEILEQFLLASNFVNGNVRNLVFMGMGEPFANLQEFLLVIESLVDKNGFGISPSRISVSTCGVFSGIEELILRQSKINLLISLHSAVQSKRDELMPGVKKYPLNQLQMLLAKYSDHLKQPVVLEYILLSGINDNDSDILALIDFSKKINAKINLIAYNINTELNFKPTPSAKINKIKYFLEQKGIIVTQRLKLGNDVAAGCGQLVVKNQKI